MHRQSEGGGSGFSAGGPVMRIGTVGAGTIALMCGVVLSIFTVMGSRKRGALERAAWLDLPNTFSDSGSGLTVFGSGRDTLWVFSDFKCPVCFELWQKVRTIHTTELDDLTIRWLHYAHLGQISVDAASAAVCYQDHPAGLELVDSLFAASRTASKEGIVSVVARHLGSTNRDSITQCISAESTRSELARIQKLHAALNANGTPILVIDGHFVDGLPPNLLQQLRKRSWR